jgi:hypothetical protein
LSDRGIDVLAQRHGSREISNDRSGVTVVVNQAWLRNVFAGLGSIGTSQNVIIAENVLCGAVSDQRTQRSATAETFRNISNVSAGHTEIEVSFLVVCSSIGQSEGNQRAANDER